MLVCFGSFSFLCGQLTSCKSVLTFAANFSRIIQPSAFMHTSWQKMLMLVILRITDVFPSEYFCKQKNSFSKKLWFYLDARVFSVPNCTLFVCQSIFQAVLPPPALFWELFSQSSTSWIVWDALEKSLKRDPHSAACFIQEGSAEANRWKKPTESKCDMTHTNFTVLLYRLVAADKKNNLLRSSFTNSGCFSKA